MSLVGKVRCEACGTLNRVPRYSIRRVPHCGSCHSNLPEPVTLKALRKISTLPITAWIGAVFIAFIGGLIAAPSVVMQSTAPITRPPIRSADCAPKEPVTVGGIMRVYDLEDHPSLTHWTLNAGSGADYFVKLVNVQTALPKVSYFVRGGSVLTAEVPIGAFVIKHASGALWCGESELFGPKTVLQKGTRIAIFDDNHTYELFLTPERNGNFPTKIISRSEF
jgi:hypothetical protein